MINADNGLALLDFRAAETTFQLLTQVASRAGEVILQTSRPKHYAIQAAMHHDYPGFYAQEIHQRESASYPPFRRMAHFLIESEDPEVAERSAVLLRRLVRESIELLHYDGLQILGPSPAVIRRIMKKYRWNIALLSRSSQRLNTLTRTARDAFQEASKSATVQLKVDLDPYGSF